LWKQFQNMKNNIKQSVQILKDKDGNPFICLSKKDFNFFYVDKGDFDLFLEIVKDQGLIFDEDIKIFNKVNLEYGHLLSPYFNDDNHYYTKKPVDHHLIIDCQNELSKQGFSGKEACFDEKLDNLINEMALLSRKYQSVAHTNYVGSKYTLHFSRMLDKFRPLLNNLK
jgi:hypothetical protein